MLQRIQTVFLFIVIILMGAFLFFPVWISNPEAGDISYTFHPFFLFTAPVGNPDAGQAIFWPYSITGGLAALSIITGLVEVFSFKNRMTQVKLGALNSLFLAGVLISAVLLANPIQDELEGAGRFSIALFFPAMAMIANLVSNRFIRKDEKLVKSMDRLR